MRAILILLVALVIVTGGCGSNKGSQSVYDKKSDLAKSTIVKDIALADAMHKSRLALREMGFKFDKFDTENGYLRTEPLSGSQLFEVWRDDNVGAYNAAMANINSIVRIVEMNFKAIEGSVYVDCKADVMQLSVRTGDITASTSDMKEAFTDSSGGFQELSVKDKQAQWLPMGRDVMLEDKILFGMRI